MPTVSHRTRFLDHYLPSLYAARYRLTVEQDIATLATGDALPERNQNFAVRGQRFSIGASEIHACYPVPGAVGKYSQILPHITLDTAGLPWARLPKEMPEGTPLVALLLFREGELPDDPQAVGAVTVSTVRQLLDGEAGAGQPPDIEDDSLLDGEAESACRSIQLPANVFAMIMPTITELALLAHIREGGPPDADHVRRTDPEPDLDELNAVVVANRFPSAEGGRHVVHLVSLEGFERYLGDTAPPSEGLRLVSLHTWAFETQHDSGIGFGDLVAHLAAEPGLLLRVLLPPGDADGDARQRLEGGATVLPQRLETGERSFGFYRGPLTAAPARSLPPPAAPRLESGGEALIYLEQWGVFDTGYASAFSLGRTLAMADAPFRNQLLQFRKAARRAARRLVAHPEFVTGRSATDAGRALGDNQARNAFDRMLGDRLVGALTRSGAQLATAPRRTAARNGGGAVLSAAGLRATLADSRSRDVLRAATAEQLDPVAEWLNRLATLDMLPFDHVVPDPRMLPPESIRFGYLDPGWVRAAVDGALSVGVGHTLDADLNTLAADVATPPGCAVLIRSVLIPHWPRTVFTAFRGEETVEPSRRAMFGSDVLMLLYPRVIDRFAVAEPPQGLHFGVGDIGTIELRQLTGQIGCPMGEFPDPAGFARFLRAGDVLDIETNLLPELAAEHNVATLSPAQFALQMIKAPQLQTFSRP
ncbi:hypothetical protein OH799_06620 [Nocardia sp. NBC_00881]|uniref:hypothetical protein n=1 Tax=Nocardia sp. NBC_00881 TaxID=2975995 RepID=UPI0038652C6A|nr:hypothetical protein OH799_06620 [Nocardia sp. NBC_00881]